MPGFVGLETKVVQAPWWSEKERAVIRKFGYGDQEAFKACYLRLEEPEGGGLAVRVYDLEQGLARINGVIIERGVVSWTDAAGELAPVTAETVRRLDNDRPGGDDAAFLLEEIAEFNPRRRRSAEEQETFRGGGRDRVEGGEQVAGRDDASGDNEGDGVELVGADGDAGVGG